MPEVIHHLAPTAQFESVPGDQPYLPPAFATDGFVHCTRELAVLLEVANRFYNHEPGQFVVLDIDPRRLAAEVRYEAAVPPGPAGSPLAGVLFPHIYGAINRDAIIAVRPARRAADGRFLSV